MFSKNGGADSLEAVEIALRGLEAAPPRVERDRLMFLAGRAGAGEASDRQGISLSTPYSINRTQHSVQRTKHRVLTAVLAATSLALALALAFRPASPPVVVYRDPPAPQRVVMPEQPSESAPTSHLVAAASLQSRDRDRDRDRPETSSSYLKTREVALRMGLDALGSPQYSAQSAEPTSYHDLWLRWTSTAATSDKPERQNSM